jgi:hypothetical protein
MDLATEDDEEAATTDFIAAQAVDLGDFFVFDIQKTRGLGEATGGAVRYRARAELAARLFEEVVIDVGFAGVLSGTPELLRGPELLTFAGIEPAEVPTLPLEQHLAEKVHAYTRSYSTGVPSMSMSELRSRCSRSATVSARRRPGSSLIAVPGGPAGMRR